MGLLNNNDKDKSKAEFTASNQEWVLAYFAYKTLPKAKMKAKADNLKSSVAKDFSLVSKDPKRRAKGQKKMNRAAKIQTALRQYGR